MVWPKLLLAVVLASHLATVAGTSSSCAPQDAIAGVCTTGTVNNGGVDVTGTTTNGGTGGNNGTGTNGGGGSGPDGPPVIWKCMEVTCDDPADPGSPPITLTDIASFRPTPGVQHMQPNGWTVPGLNTNFYAVTGVQVVNGTLLGQPASVRFTPVSFHWTYGDGTTATRSTKGGTWSGLGVHEFDKTPTSHVYKKDGSYTIRLVIDFAAEYRFAGSAYYPIAGVLPLRANDLHITVDGAKTVLVEHDCAANPNGPGC
ncbi:hypothetical protein BH09ACT4_BH09ACT4_00890 [soil metagenome]